MSLADQLWNNVKTYPKVSEEQKKIQQIYHAIYFSPFVQFGSIKELLHNVSEDTLEGCIEELYMMPTMDGGWDEEEINDESRIILHGNMYHEIARLDRLMTYTWQASPEKKKKKRAFF